MASAPRDLAIWSVLQQRSRTFERRIVRLGQYVTVVCLILSGLVALFAWELGVAAAIASSLVLVWFSLSFYLLGKPRLVPAMRWANPVFEAILPAVALGLLAWVQGPAYALGSWVPAQLFSIFNAASLLRMRVGVPLVMGTAGGLAYLATYLAWIRPMLGADPPLLFGTRMQVVRALSLVLTGMAGSLILRAIRATVRQAGREARSKDLFGKYRVLGKIAAGATGTVHEAIYAPEGGFERRVALKLVHPHLADDAEVVDHFRTEASLAAHLVHPHIVTALDFGRVDDLVFFAMEYVDGVTVRDLRERARTLQTALPPHLVAELGRDVAEGLYFAHCEARDDEGRLLRVLHRDLSPDNILVDQAGRVKISDFGLSRALREDQAVRTRTVAGTPAYLSPEALQHEDMDGRSDLWSLGVVLWELLTGERLFDRGGEAATLLAVVQDEVPPPSLLRPELDPAWDALFARLLTRDPQARFADGAELAEALDALGADPAAPSATLAEWVVDTLETLPPRTSSSRSRSRSSLSDR